MNTLITVLKKLPISEKEVESVLTDLENWVNLQIDKKENQLRKESIYPIQKENDGIRAEIRLLVEKMESSFRRVDERFLQLDQKMSSIRENLEIQIKSTRESLESQIKSSRENLESQIRSVESQMKQDREMNRERYQFQEKLLYTIIGFNATFFIGFLLRFFTIR